MHLSLSHLSTSWSRCHLLLPLREQRLPLFRLPSSNWPAQNSLQAGTTGYQGSTWSYILPESLQRWSNWSTPGYPATSGTHSSLPRHRDNPGQSRRDAYPLLVCSRLGRGEEGSSCDMWQVDRQYILYSCHSWVAKHWLHKPGVLGSATASLCPLSVLPTSGQKVAFKLKLIFVHQSYVTVTSKVGLSL